MSANMAMYLSEFFGTLLLVFLGDGICANVNLKKSNMAGQSAMFVIFGWGLAVAIPAMCMGNIGGASFNPVLTIALACIGSFDWALVPGYIVAQMLGGFVGAWVVYLGWKPHFDAEEDGDLVRGCFCTGPSVRNIPFNMFQEALSTFCLVFFIVAIPAVTGTIALNFLYVACIIWVIGYATGGMTGFAMNPARDTAPRIAYATMPFKSVKNKNADWGYALVPIIGPLVGAIVGAFAAQACVTNGLDAVGYANALTAALA